ncbi:hypothetical protein BsWGS_25216 [Bradybaena similaris]
MTQTPIDLKLFSEVKLVLSMASNATLAARKTSDRPMLGSFSYFGLGGLLPKNPYDQVYPGIWLGEASMALKPNVLKLMGITHVVNVCMGRMFSQTNTSSEFYKVHDIEFFGIPAMDIPNFNLLSYLRPAADFIDEALGKKGKVYVHCQQGVSRSATVVIAFLMLKRNMDLLTAVQLVRQKREIYPNDGFVRQLCELSKEIGFPRGF